MQPLLIAAAVVAHIPLYVQACSDHAPHVYARQVSSSSSVASTTSSAASGATSSLLSSTVSGASSVSGNATSTSLTQVSVSLISENPTAVPLSSIIVGESSSPTIALPTTFAAGATPSGIDNAPVLPDVSTIIASNYPTMDKQPPLDSDEVQQWILEVNNSGISIPDFSPTIDSGACASNPDAVADSSRCWWTCGGCTRDTDITTCPDKLTWGLTYDDGPAFYTPNLLQYLDEQQLKTTFFTIGSRVLESPRTLQTEYMSGHQIGVHTWSHPPLTTLSTEEIIAEFGWTKKIIKDVIGVTPNTFRPPYGDIDDRVRAIAAAMGLTPVIWTRISATATFDTQDFDINGGTVSSSEVINNFNQIMGNATTIDTGFIVLEHDLFEQTVQLATGYILPEALAHQPSFKLQPVITCQGMPMANAYIETNDNSTNPPPQGTASAGSTQASDSSSGSSSGALPLVDSQAAWALTASSVLGAVLGVSFLGHN